MKKEELDNIEAFYMFFQKIEQKADDYRGSAPLWHGWALRVAFLEGIKYQLTKQEELEYADPMPDLPDYTPKHNSLDAGCEDGYVAQRIYLELVKRKWAELHPTFTDCRWFGEQKMV